MNVSPAFHEDLAHACNAWLLHMESACDVGDEDSVSRHLADLKLPWFSDLGLKAVAIFDEQRGKDVDAKRLSAAVLGVDLVTYYRHRGHRRLQR